MCERRGFDATRRAFWPVAVFIALGIDSGAIGSSALGQVPAGHAELLDAMRARAEATEVQAVDPVDDLRFIPRPVFRYDDQPRGFVDATLWIWTTEDGRPAAFQKIEAMERDGPPRWNYCFASFSRGRLSARWPGGLRFESTKPAITFQHLPGAAAPADGKLRWGLSARRLARMFSAEIRDAATDDREQMRLLPTPIYEYEVSGRDACRGAVFAFATYGTNPDLLFALESRTAGSGQWEWQYAVARMTNGAVTLLYGGREIWRVDQVSSRDGVLPTWTFFGEPRERAATRPPLQGTGS